MMDAIKARKVAPKVVQDTNEVFETNTESVSRRCWSETDGTFSDISQTHDALPPGMYRPEPQPPGRIVLRRLTVHLDDLIDLPDSPTGEIVNEIDRFWDLHHEYTSRGFLHKRGILTWGDPGGGKTVTVQMIASRIIARGGVAVMIQDLRLATGGLQMLRRVEPDRPVVVFIEDIDAAIQVYGEESLLSLLDGENQIDRVVYLATTNYPEKLDKRIIDRPSRFDYVVCIPMPSAADRRMFLKTKEPSLKDNELDEWVRLSDGFSIAHLKEMIIAVRILGHDPKKVVARLRQMMERKTTSDEARGEKAKIGFAAGDTDGDLDNSTSSFGFTKGR